MQDFILEHYSWVKALHVISVMAWVAGLLYLPRLFVYHVGSKIGSEMSQTFKIMERRLLKFIMNPAMILAWIFGGVMLWSNPDLMSQGWMHVKLTFIILMTGIHHAMMKWVKIFAADQNRKSAQFYKIMNEAPTVFMIVIVLMAVVKPF